MKRYHLILMFSFLLAGCSSPLPFGTMQPASPAASAAKQTLTRIPIESPLFTASIQVTEAPNNSPEEISASTLEPSLPVVAGLGMKIGEISIASIDRVYYYRDFWPDGDNRFFRIYAMDRKTGKSRVIRTLRDCAQMESIFLDGQCRLYYVTQNADMSFSLWLYQKTGDRLIGSAGAGVLRVDDRFIYTDDLWYSLNDFSPRQGNQALFTPWIEDDYIATGELRGNATEFSVRSVKRGGVTTCLVGCAIEPESVRYAIISGAKLYLVTSDPDLEQSVIYRIDIGTGVVEKADSFGFVITDCSFYDSRIYFVTDQWVGEYKRRSLWTYVLSDGKTALFARLGDTTNEEQRTCIDICGGYVWAYLYGSADYSGYSEPQMFPLT